MVLVGRFSDALRALYCRDYQKCLSLMNFTTIGEEFEQMPTTKIVTNVIGSFINNNAGLTHFHLGLPAVALAYLSKAKALLTKACTGVEDKDLHLFSLNYGSYIESITYNQALVMLAVRPKESYHQFESIRKSGQMSRSYKFWYRMAQSILQHYHDPKVLPEQKRTLLNTALATLNNALHCLDRFIIPSASQLKNLTKFAPLQEEDIEAIIMKMKSEVLHFRQSTLTLICYVSLGLGLWRKAIRIGQSLLEDKKLDQKNRMDVLHYVLEAQSQLGKSTLILRQYLDHLQQELSREKVEAQVLYVRPEGDILEESDYETLFYHQLMRVHLWEDNPSEAYKCC
jgi:tetratricopeptide (TPR) repeat protein